MKLRFAWLGDAELEDSYSAREARIFLRALARRLDIVPLWFAVGSTEPPHFWNGIRVFPVPSQFLSAAFLNTLIDQQRPHIVLSNLSIALLLKLDGCLNRKDIHWMHRLTPQDLQSGCRPLAPQVLVGEEGRGAEFTKGWFVPYIKGLDPIIRGGVDASTALQKLDEVIAPVQASHLPMGSAGEAHLIMRQQLYYNSSLSTVMFELTNALLQAGAPAVPQDELGIFSGNNFHRDKAFFRSGAPEKYERIRQNLHKKYDPETAITMHFILPKSSPEYTRCGTFPSLAGKELLYVTGNHTVSPEKVWEISSNFKMVLAPSNHVLRPYLEAGLDHRLGAVLPHGFDPQIFYPAAPPFQYPTKKRFKFLQTSFPWVLDKGFDLTIKAFGKAFSHDDDVALILRIPRIRNAEARKLHFGPLEALVKQELARGPGAPEIHLLEVDTELSLMGGVYTGADCYVHPLRAEGFGLTILEALACGLPVIATPWSGPADFLSPEWSYPLRHSEMIPEKSENGTILRYRVEPALDHLIDLMRHAYEHSDNGRALGKRAAEMARNRWTWKHAAAKLISIVSMVGPANGFKGTAEAGNGKKNVPIMPAVKQGGQRNDLSEDNRRKANLRSRISEQPMGECKDKNDDRAATKGRKLHNGYKLTKHNFTQPAPLFFTQDHHPLWLGDIYRGRSAFLVAGGPSFATLDHSKLRQPGILTMGINNSVKTFRPHLWISVDGPDHFLRSIWLDPTIMKFVPIGHAGKFIFNSNEWKFTPVQVGDCPNVVYYRRNEHFKATQFLWEDTINWGNHKNHGGGRSVMLAALRVLFILGIRRVYLLGVDFKMNAETKYHFEQDRDVGSIRGNNNTYRALNRRFSKLRPHFEKENFLVFNCNPESNLKAFDFLSYDTAIQNALEEFDLIDVHNERTKGLYETKRDDKKQQVGK